jgi:glyoxylase-like metal-dependent hydrolase (beta-lactamase superfamily II)
MTTIHTYAASPEAFLVNSFLIETDKGVVVVDTQFLVTPAKALKQKVLDLGKPLLDGLDSVPIYATQATYDGVKETEAIKREFWTPTYQDEYPKSTLLPTEIIKPGGPLIIDGVRLVIDDLGAGEASDITVIYLPEQQQLIASDLVYY